MCCQARQSAHQCCVVTVILLLVQYLLITAGDQPFGHVDSSTVRWRAAVRNHVTGTMQVCSRRQWWRKPKDASQAACSHHAKT